MTYTIKRVPIAVTGIIAEKNVLSTVSVNGKNLILEIWFGNSFKEDVPAWMCWNSKRNGAPSLSIMITVKVALCSYLDFCFFFLFFLFLLVFFFSRSNLKRMILKTLALLNEGVWEVFVVGVVGSSFLEVKE